MSVPLVIANTTFNYPTSGQSPNWAEEASSWAVAVTEALNTLLGPGDILQSSSEIKNNISSSSPELIQKLLFDPGVVRAANIFYSVYRTSDTTTSGAVETGMMFVIFDDAAIDENKWRLTQNKNNDAGVVFSIDHNGQMYYYSSDIGDAGHSGLMKFSAKALTKI